LFFEGRRDRVFSVFKQFALARWPAREFAPGVTGNTGKTRFNRIWI
jgi:hypothetical protein